MKTLITSFVLLCTIFAQGQTARHGNTFVQTKRESVKDTLITKYNYQSRDGKQHPIIINKKTGACWIWKTSKNGKGYRQYIPKDVKETITKELKINIKK